MNKQQDFSSRLEELEQQVDILDGTVTGMGWAFNSVLAGVLAQLEEEQVENILDSAVPNSDFSGIPGAADELRGVVEHLEGATDVLNEIIRDIGEQVARIRETN